MITNNCSAIPYIIIYAISILLFLNSNGLICSWICLEINLLAFVMLSILYNSKNPFKINFIINFMVIQVAGSSIFLSCSLVNKEPAALSLTFLVILSLFLNMAATPFSLWLLNDYDNLDNTPLSILISAQNLPYLCILSSTDDNFIFFLIILNIAAGSVLIFNSSTLNEILVASSIYNTSWLWILMWVSYLGLLFFVGFYTMLNFYIIRLADQTSSCKSPGKNKTAIVLSIIFFIGLPLSLGFYLNVITLSLVPIFPSKIIIMTLIWTSISISLAGYLNILLNSISLTINNTSNTHQSKFAYGFPMFLILTSS